MLTKFQSNFKTQLYSGRRWTKRIIWHILNNEHNLLLLLIGTVFQFLWCVKWNASQREPTDWYPIFSLQICQAHTLFANPWNFRSISAAFVIESHSDSRAPYFCTTINVLELTNITYSLNDYFDLDHLDFAGSFPTDQYFCILMGIMWNQPVLDTGRRCDHFKWSSTNSEKLSI